MHVLEGGVRVEVLPVGDNEISYGYHDGVDYHQDRIYDQLRLDVMNDRGLVFDVRRISDITLFRVSYLRVVNPKFRVNHDLTFSLVERRTRVLKRTPILQA